jgi:hypothetical protein
VISIEAMGQNHFANEKIGDARETHAQFDILMSRRQHSSQWAERSAAVAQFAASPVEGYQLNDEFGVANR